MSDRLFNPPVLVKDGKYLIQEVLSLADAIEVLEDWPADTRDLMHETVLRACHAAAAGTKPVHAARTAFEKFATKKGILEDPARIMPRFPGSGMKCRAATA